MALILCPECKREISDAAQSCPHCGHPISSNSKTPQQVEVTSIKISTKNPQKIIFGIIGVLAIIAVIIVAITISNKNKAALSRQKYIENLGEARTTMLYGAAEAESVCNLTKSVWYNTIHEKKDSETDKYTMTRSKFNDDFNTSLSSLYSDQNIKYKIDTIKDNQDKVSDIMMLLNNPPEDLSSAYDTVQEMYDIYLKFTKLAISPSGSLNTYSTNFSEYDTNFMGCYDKLGNQIPTENDK